MAMNRSDAETLWTVARVLARTAAKVSRCQDRRRPNMPPLLFFTDPERTPRPWETVAGLPLGCGVVFRHFGQSDAYDTALRLRDLTFDRKAMLLIGLDADLAARVGADGVHLPERAVDQAQAIAATYPDWRITGAVHGLGPLPTIDGLDALVVSPVFQTTGSSAASTPLGVEGLKKRVQASPCPVYALGGIDSSNVSSLIGTGAYGLAGVSAIQAAFATSGPSSRPGT